METIKNELKNIFKNRFHIELNDRDFDDNVSLGPKGLDLLASYILYIIDDIEKRFQFQFSPESLQSREFTRLNGLTEIIYKECGSRSGID